MCQLADATLMRALITWLYPGRASYALLHPTGLGICWRACSSFVATSA